jgi:hypothetical protein
LIFIKKKECQLTTLISVETTQSYQIIW